jgi:hypothetical protein
MNASNKNKKAVLRIENQFVEIEAMSPRDETDLMPGEAADILFRHAVDIRIPRAYLPRPYEDFDIAEGAELNVQVVKEINDYDDNYI